VAEPYRRGQVGSWLCRHALDAMKADGVEVVELGTGGEDVEVDRGRLKARLRAMRGLKQVASPARIAAGRAFVQNLRRGHYGLATDTRPSCASRRPSPNSHSLSERGSRRAGACPLQPNATRPVTRGVAFGSLAAAGRRIRHG
jgi:hypothetical protein